ncbi:uncharacterized protein SCODWIG_02882 [Saccharomycodes ludwigii]|uniref:BTB domain-containing protein n=1 Tax=Saccharomycodes ludwigii TaxID=36035 RepID=A0A376B928_9ASCO|nr:hypothetical protein SCDLUD_000789 [Saccharomycodes ludwigii]KAH3903175.1 hypothetical protein SCDLUD_000789 [Saccharomycodes ludwigii]SSD61121.1 uncharacterized protein SCODWIG_02882 [Saccharomycodes ludwigii]
MVKSLSVNNNNTNKDSVSEKRDIFGRNLSCLLAYTSSTTTKNISSINAETQELESGYSPLHICLRLGHIHQSYLINENWKKIVKGKHVKDEKLEKEKIWRIKDREGLNPLELYKTDNNMWNSNNIYPLSLHNGNITYTKRDIKKNEEVFRRKKVKTSIDLRRINDIYLNKRGGRELYTFGSNINMQLGTGDSDDRRSLFKIDEFKLYGAVDNNNYRKPKRFKRVLMHKYHSILQTLNDEIYTCGNGVKGRLGIPSLKRSLVFKKVELPLGLSIKQIVSSDNHTLILSKQNELISWGSNNYNQLGYPTDTLTQNISISSEKYNDSPRKLSSHLWKRSGGGSKILFVGCSNVHSCIIDNMHYLHSWGLDLGQMGNSHSPIDKLSVQYKNKFKGYIKSTPYLFKLPSNVKIIKQLLCTDFATFVLHDENELIVLTNSKILKFSIPRLGQQQNSFEKFIPTALTRQNLVVELKCTNMYGNNLCALYENGTIGIFHSKNFVDNSSWLTIQNNILPFELYWLPYFELNNCLDFQVGYDGQLILTTLGGDIFYSNTVSTTSFEKNMSSKLLSGRCIRVSSNAQFSSFAIIKDDVDMIPMSITKNRFYLDFRKFSPIYENLGGAVEEGEYRMLNFINNVQSSTTDKEHGIILNAEFDDGDDDDDDDDDDGDGKKEELTGEIDKTKGSYLLRAMSTRWKATNAGFNYKDAFMKTSNISLINEEQLSFIRNDYLNYDVLFFDGNNCVGKCHKSLLYTRCPTFVSNMKTFQTQVSSNNKVKFELRTAVDSKIWEICISNNSDNISHFNTTSLKYALHYMYSDELLKFHGNIKNKKELELSTMNFINELGMNVTAFEDDKLAYNVKNLYYRLLENKCDKGDGEIDFYQDVTIKLSDGETIKCHSLILSARSLYFKSLFQYNWQDNEVVDLCFYTYDEVMCVLKYIYGFDIYEMFITDNCNDVEHLNFENCEDFVNFLVNIQKLCDFLLLDDLKASVESILADYISSSSVVPLLINSFTMHCSNLFIECCWYLFNNIGLLYNDENTIIINEYFSTELWISLEKSIRDMMNKNTLVGKEKSWYELGHNIEYLELFKKDISKFNKIFMDSKKPFKPLFDNKRKGKYIHSNNVTGNTYGSTSEYQFNDESNQVNGVGAPHSRRASSSVSSLRRTSSTHSNEELLAFRRNSFVRTKFSELGISMSANAISDDDDSTNDGFIAVQRNPAVRRKSCLGKALPNLSSNKNNNTNLPLRRTSQSTPVEDESILLVPQTSIIKFENIKLKNSTENCNNTQKSNMPSKFVEFFPSIDQAIYSNSNLKKTPDENINTSTKDSKLLDKATAENLLKKVQPVKKLSQKERLKHLTSEHVIEDKKKTKVNVWGKRNKEGSTTDKKGKFVDDCANNKDTNDTITNSGNMISPLLPFPSLSEIDSSRNTIAKRKNGNIPTFNPKGSSFIIPIATNDNSDINKKNNFFTTMPLTSTGVVVKPNSSAIPNYLNNTKEKFKAQLEKPPKTFQEKYEEEKFAQWWEEETKKVQQQLKKEKEYEDELKRLYNPTTATKKNNDCNKNNDRRNKKFNLSKKKKKNNGDIDTEHSKKVCIPIRNNIKKEKKGKKKENDETMGSNNNKIHIKR